MVASCRKETKAPIKPIQDRMGFFVGLWVMTPPPLWIGGVFYYKGVKMVQIKDKIRTVTFLTREQIDYLDKLGKDALFYQGHKISRSQILAELVNFLIGLGISMQEVDLHDETLADGLLDLLHNNHDEKKDEYKTAL